MFDETEADATMNRGISATDGRPGLADRSWFSRVRVRSEAICYTLLEQHNSQSGFSSDGDGLAVAGFGDTGSQASVAPESGSEHGPDL
jgi:hypothetical protein